MCFGENHRYDKQCTLKAEPKVLSKLSATSALHIVPLIERSLRVFNLSVLVVSLNLSNS